MNVIFVTGINDRPRDNREGVSASEVGGHLAD